MFGVGGEGWGLAGGPWNHCPLNARSEPWIVLPNGLEVPASLEALRRYAKATAFAARVSR